MRRAVAAAVAVAAGHGVRCAEPEVLSDRANALVRLGPAPVVARVATITGLMRRGAYDALCREVAVTGYLAGVGAPVVPPSDALPPGPHIHDGLTVTFWPYVPHEPGAAPSPERFGALLRELHTALAGYPGGLAYLGTPYDDIAVMLGGAVPGLTAEERAATSRAFEKLRAELGEGPGRPLHGDAHPRNLMSTPGGWLWNDFEDTCAGPVEWDLACMVGTRRLDGRAAVTAYGRDPDDPRIAVLRELRDLYGGLYSRLSAAYP
jgi:hypothetical protein